MELTQEERGHFLYRLFCPKGTECVKVESIAMIFVSLGVDGFDTKIILRSFREVKCPQDSSRTFFDAYAMFEEQI